MGVKISTGDVEVEGETVREAVNAYRAIQENPKPPAATLGSQRVTVEDLIESWYSKAASSSRHSHARAAYQDAAEKLETLCRGGSLTEAP